MKLKILNKNKNEKKERIEGRTDAGIGVYDDLFHKSAIGAPHSPLPPLSIEFKLGLGLRERGSKRFFIYFFRRLFTSEKKWNFFIFARVLVAPAYL